MRIGTLAVMGLAGLVGTSGLALAQSDEQYGGPGARRPRMQRRNSEDGPAAQDQQGFRGGPGRRARGRGREDGDVQDEGLSGEDQVAPDEEQGGPGNGRRRPHRRGPSPLFRALDTDDDGALSPEEINNAAAVLAALDDNGDGIVYPREVIDRPRPHGRGHGEGNGPGQGQGNRPGQGQGNGRGRGAGQGQGYGPGQNEGGGRMRGRGPRNQEGNQAAGPRQYRGNRPY